MHTIGEALTWAESELGKAQRLDAELLLCQLLNKQRSFLFAFSEQPLSQGQSETFQQQLQQLKQGKPVAYILGEREFWSLPFKVSSDTLIPRPDTETLVEFVLCRFQKKASVKLLDAGTGTGAIAISLKKESPNWQIFALDYSFKALQIAKENTQNLHAHVPIFQGNWLSAIKSQTLDVVVANPPYIEPSDNHLNDLKFEPISALVAQNQGLSDIETLIQQSQRVLKKGGELWFEHGFEQSEKSQQLLQQAGFSDVQSVKDLSGNWRITGGVCNGW